VISLISNRLFVLALVLAAAAAVALSAIGSGSALSVPDFEKRLQDAGYKVTPGDTGVEFGGIKQKGTKVVIEKDGKTTTVVVVAYKSIAELKAEWGAEAGKAPKPKATTKDFDGKTVYWNNDSVLVVDRGAGIEASVGAVFLGRNNDGGKPAPSPTPAPPKTGTGTIGNGGESTFNSALIVGGMALLVIGGTIGLAARRSSN
jgi:hypothetical protein